MRKLRKKSKTISSFVCWLLVCIINIPENCELAIGSAKKTGGWNLSLSSHDDPMPMDIQRMDIQPRCLIPFPRNLPVGNCGCIDWGIQCLAFPFLVCRIFYLQLIHGESV